MKVERERVSDFIGQHGGVLVAGDSPEGPSYQLADGWTLLVPLDRRAEPAALPPSGSETAL